MTNIEKLLSIDAEQIDDIREMLADILNGHLVDIAGDIQLDRLGSLLHTLRRTGESDSDYRTRLKNVIPSLIGGGTHDQLKKVIKLVIPGITDNDIVIEDDYTGGDSYYGHFRIRIYNFETISFNAGELYNELDKSRAAGVKMDYVSPTFVESQTQQDVVDFTFGLNFIETQNQNDNMYWEFSTTLGESQTNSVNDDFDRHIVNVTRTNSLNVTT